MNVLVRLYDETLQGARTEAVVLDFDAERVTVRELIRRRVAEEVRRHAEAPGEPFVGLVQPAPLERALNTARRTRAPPPPREIDPEAQARVACEAFEHNGFFVLVDDHQVTELDAMVVLRPDVSISFVRLVPLVGG